MKRVVKVILGIVFLVAIFFGVLAYAQIKTDEVDSTPSRKKAEVNYDIANNFYIAGKYEDAAIYFLKADRFFPSEIALIQAFRAYHRADQRLKAQEMALVYMYRYSGKQLPNAKLYTDIVCIRRDELEALKARFIRDIEVFGELLKDVSFIDVDAFKNRLLRNVAVIDALLNDRSITSIPANPF
jgi:hypothetical protein